MSEPAYRIEGLSYAYPGSRDPFVLDLAELTIGAGDILALAGPNGAGKTTLLMLLALLLKPGRGRLAFFGALPWAENEGPARARRDVVFVSHNPYLFKGTVFDNLAFGLKVRKIPEPEWAGRTAEALSLVELEGWEKKAISVLSTGQAQRVALARAMVLRPKILLLDEPTANIDAALAVRIEAVIRDVSRERSATVVFSTHNFSQATRLADDILFLSGGKKAEFSHENCFSGQAGTDGLVSWIEPWPGARIVFPGSSSGHVTCVINPADIHLIPAGDRGAGEGPNVFAGRVTRLETTEEDTALVRVSGDLTFRVLMPVGELERGGISLSRRVLVTFDLAAVRIVRGSTPESDDD